MSKLPYVSIIIAVKDGAVSVSRALQSIFDQSYQNFEIIIIDDASNDASPALLLEWQKKIGPRRCHIIRNSESHGQTAALNQGLAQAKGTYIARLDADDWWTNEKIEKQILWLSQHSDYGLLGSAWINHALEQNKVIHPPQSDNFIRRRIWWRNPFAHSCVIFRRDLLKKVSGYNETIRYGQDLDLWFRLLPHTKLANLPDILCHRTVTRDEDKQRAQMRQTLKTLTKYSLLYRPSWRTRGGFIEPWLLVHADRLMPIFLLVFFYHCNSVISTMERS